MYVRQKIIDLANQLGRAHVEALRRLAASTAATGFPLALEIYRDLIRLELIADGGRSLRLSPLGQEVLRHLADDLEAHH
jgi:hypothetical protein